LVKKWKFLIGQKPWSYPSALFFLHAHLLSTSQSCWFCLKTGKPESTFSYSCPHCYNSGPSYHNILPKLLNSFMISLHAYTFPPTVCFLYKTPMIFFIQVGEILKFIWNHRKTPNNQSNLEQKEQKLEASH
jgi:hypothetical protein